MEDQHTCLVDDCIHLIYTALDGKTRILDMSLVYLVSYGINLIV